MDNIVRSLLFKLAPLSPRFLHDLYQQHHSGKREIEQNTLLQAVHRIIAQVNHHIFIIIDALDECPVLSGERKKVLQFLQQVKEWRHANLHVLITSRDEHDISYNLRNMGFQEVAMEESDVNCDIFKYISGQLQSDRNFSQWPTSVHNKICSSLMTSANGM